MLQGSTIHPLPPQGLFCVQRDVQIHMECTVRTVKMNKAHLWSHSSKKHRSFRQQTLSSSADGHLYREWCTSNQSSPHLPQCWEQGQVFTELLHIVAPVRPVAQYREPASWGSSSGECTNTINRYVAHGKCMFYVRTNGISVTNLHKYTGKQITCHKSTLYYK